MRELRMGCSPARGREVLARGGGMNRARRGEGG
jgi:hypothetical protein